MLFFFALKEKVLRIVSPVYTLSGMKCRLMNDIRMSYYLLNLGAFWIKGSISHAKITNYPLHLLPCGDEKQNCAVKRTPQTADEQATSRKCCWWLCFSSDCQAV